VFRNTASRQFWLPLLGVDRNPAILPAGSSL
jgi:hypothetical protein